VTTHPESFGYKKLSNCKSEYFVSENLATACQDAIIHGMREDTSYLDKSKNSSEVGSNLPYPNMDDTVFG
jgi:hypothetical protein